VAAAAASESMQMGDEADDNEEVPPETAA